MADRAAAGRGGADPKIGVGAQRLTTPAWLDQRERTTASKDKVTTVKRYFAGQAPTWAAGQEEEEEAPAPAAQRARPVAPPVLLRRPEDAEPAPGMRREVRAPEVVLRARDREAEPAPVQAPPAPAEEEEEELSDDEIDRRRAAARQRALERRALEPEVQVPVEEEEEEEEDESEWETDTDEDDAPGRKLIKPVFVPKAERESLAERDARLLEEEQAAEREAARKAARAADSRAVVAVLLERDAAVAAAEEQAEPSDVDTDDEAHEAEEYDAWQARELARVTRDREERERSFREKEEMERLRAMTDEEREEWDRTHPPPQSEAQAAKEKAKWSFMQKYYHKGAFFQSGADDKFGTIGTFDIYKRDFSAATGEDKGTDRSMLPKAMQVRKGVFGRAGQVKWTHLSAEDTTRKKDDEWGRDPAMRNKDTRLTGANQPLSKPRHLTR